VINHDRVNKRFYIKNNTLHTVIDYSRGVKIAEFCNGFTTIKSNVNKELIVLDFIGRRYSSADFSVKSAAAVSDKTRELAVILLENKELAVDIRVNFLNDKKDSLNIIIQVADHHKDGIPHNMYFHSPFLAGIEYSGDDIYYYPGAPVKAQDGTMVIRPVNETIVATDIKLPLVVCDRENKFGFSVRFPLSSDLMDEGAAQNRNIALTQISSADELKNHRVPLAPDSTFNDSIEFEIIGLRGGWPEAFDRFREVWQSDYELSEYRRKDLKWFNDCVVHNFCFLYGNEGFDFGKKRVDVEKLLKSGEDFGGYDTVTIWNSYPHLGVDKRSQWDYYDDFPGGRQALKEMVDEFHKHGVKVFLPFLPWDRGYDESTRTMSDNLAKLIEDTGADGVHLDTMETLPDCYRKKLDKLRPGIVLTSENHPMKKRPLEIITTSWDEFWTAGCMPQIDILRFMLPCHIAPAVSRWYRKEDKDKLINYAVFGAEPIVIWQDVFGRWMPYTEKQKAKIKLWKKVYLENKSVYQGSRPIPIYPVKPKNLYCNLFSADDGSQDIYSLYNDTDSSIDGEILTLADPDKNELSVVFGDAKAEISNGNLYASIPPKEVVHIRLKRPRNMH